MESRDLEYQQCKFKTVYRNLQHQPRIWGVSYVKLFATLFAALFAMMMTYYVLGAITSMGIAAGVLAVGYGVSFFLDSRDPVRFDGAFLRNTWTSYTPSGARVRIIEE